jgi:putative transposase
MANTYTQIHVQFVFAVRKRECLIQNPWKDELYKYITGIVQNQQHQHKLLAINGMADHIHILVGMRPTQSISDLLQDIKGSSSKWINEKGVLESRFSWQQGFGAFSYSKSDVKKVIDYINKQEIHHRKIDFVEEYKSILKQFNIDFNEQYIFKDVLQADI